MTVLTLALTLLTDDLSTNTARWRLAVLYRYHVLATSFSGIAFTAFVQA